MAVDNFIPEVWAGQILVNLRKTHVAANVVNRNYEGDISAYGDRVHINNLVQPTIRDYTKNTNMEAADTLDDAQRSLVIDQAKYFNFQIDDIDTAQQRPKIMQEAMNEASHGLADQSDQYLLSLHTDVHADNQMGEQADPIALDKDNIYEHWVHAGMLLDEANVPRGNRWSIVPPWVHAQMVRSPEFIRSTQLGDNTVLNGMVGQIAGFNILLSNNVDSTYGEADVLFGYPGAVTFAEQILNVEAYTPELRFADAVKGLYVYGAKVTRPKGLVVGYFDAVT